MQSYFVKIFVELITERVTRHAVTEPLNILVACGPYTPSDGLTFDPLLDLIGVIVRDSPDVCLLVRLHNLSQES